jgi:hypothetical protein
MVKALTLTVFLTLACLTWSVYDFFKDAVSPSFAADQINTFTLHPAIKSQNGHGLPLQEANDHWTVDRQSSRLASVPFSSPVESSGPGADVQSIARAYPTHVPIPTPANTTHSSMANNLNVNARGVREVFAEDVLARRTARGQSATRIAEGEDYAN